MYVRLSRVRPRGVAPDNKEILSSRMHCGEPCTTVRGKAHTRKGAIRSTKGVASKGTGDCIVQSSYKGLGTNGDDPQAEYRPFFSK